MSQGGFADHLVESIRDWRDVIRGCKFGLLAENDLLDEVRAHVSADETFQGLQVRVGFLRDLFIFIYYVQRLSRADDVVGLRAVLVDELDGNLPTDSVE